MESRRLKKRRCHGTKGVRPRLAPGWSSTWGKEVEIRAGCVLKVNPKEGAVFDYQRRVGKKEDRAQDRATLYTVGASKAA